MSTLTKVAGRFPFLYFSFRCGMLGLTFAALAAWFVTGFNVVEGGVPVIGIQWSTFATFSFFFYLLMVNFQMGGLRTFTQLKGAVRMDLHFLRTLKRSEYPQEAATPPFMAVFVSLMACMAALFAFEAIWVPLYDYFQFGSLTWPVYFAITSPNMIIRNVGLTILPILTVWIVFSLAKDYKVEIKPRFSEASVELAVLAGLFWMMWITLPHSTAAITAVIGPQANTFNLASCYVFPKQEFFPQNTYTFYPCALLGKSYTPPQILGFFNPDPWVHAVNVLTKFVTFAAICFPFMATVRRAE